MLEEKMNAPLIERLKQSNIKDYVKLVLRMMEKGADKTMDGSS